MKKIINSALATVVFLFICGTLPLSAQQKEAPAKVAAPLILKLCALEKNILNNADNISIYVLSAPEVTKEFKQVLGQKLGQLTVKSVEEGNELPKTKPSILYIGDATKVENAIKYTQTNKILSATGIPELIKKGVTLGIGLGEDDRPKILLNLNSTVKEGLNWSPAIMKIAMTIK